MHVPFRTFPTINLGPSILSSPLLCFAGARGAGLLCFEVAVWGVLCVVFLAALVSPGFLF